MNLYDLTINHPGRILALQHINYHCTAATPPSKGGETYALTSYHKTMLRLTALVMGVGLNKISVHYMTK
jgi:hypothetical protein